MQAGENSPIGRQALSEAGELKDRLMDLKSAIKTTGQDGRALQASLQLGGGIVAGFGAVQGVMALVGSESEDLQKHWLSCKLFKLPWQVLKKLGQF